MTISEESVISHDVIEISWVTFNVRINKNPGD